MEICKCIDLDISHHLHLFDNCRDASHPLYVKFRHSAHWIWSDSGMEIYILFGYFLACLEFFVVLLFCVFTDFDFSVRVWFSNRKTMTWSWVIFLTLWVWLSFIESSKCMQALFLRQKTMYRLYCVDMLTCLQLADVKTRPKVIRHSSWNNLQHPNYEEKHSWRQFNLRHNWLLLKFTWFIVLAFLLRTVETAKYSSN